MRKAEIAICAVYSNDEAVVSAHACERGVVAFSRHPVDGAIPYFRDPLFRAGLTDPERLPSPQLGEHGEEVRRELGFADGSLPNGRRK
jgi:crotonobetainyl-CoA:carnitine CoA-transferase CaiB-like acyl-CoA transferase